MKLETRNVYIAYDGKEFPTEAQCLAHEREHAGGRLVGLTAEQIAAALAGEDRDIAQAIEDAAHKIRKRRYEAGDLKRQRRAKAGDATPVEASTSAPTHPFEEGAAQ